MPVPGGRPFELKAGEVVGLDDALVERRPHGELVVREGGHAVSDVDPAVVDSDRVAVVPLGDWFLALGDESSRLLRWRSGEPRIAVDHVPRISFAGAYNAGGLYRTAFFAVPEARCLVAKEECVALVHRDRGVLWTYVHTDLTLVVEAVTRHAVVLLSESDRSTLDLDTGRFVTSEPTSWQL